MHIFHAAAVLGAGGDDINSCGVDAAVTENVGKLDDVLFDAVKHAGEKVAQVVRKYFLRIDVRGFAQGFHFTPDVCAAYRVAGSCYKNHTAFYSARFCVAEQLLTEFFNNKYYARF